MNCHGSDGKMGMSGARDLSASLLSHDEKVNLIKQGKNAMMSFEDQLTQEQIEAVTVYVETLK